MPKFIKLTEHSTGTVYFVNASNIQHFHFWDTKTQGTCTHIDMGRPEMQVKESAEEILALIENP